MSAEAIVEPISEEATLVRDKAILGNLKVIVERNLKGISASTYLFKKLFVAVTQLILNRINNDIRLVHVEMSKRRIKIVGEEQVDNILYYRFTVKGQEERIGITRELLRSEISFRLGMYVKFAIG